MKKPIRAAGAPLLVLCAFIWGSAFVAQSHGGDMGDMTFNALRSFIGCAALAVTLLLRKLFRRRRPDYRPTERSVLLRSIKGGLLCGSVLAVSSLFQQIGIGHTTVGNAGFITALYILIVPILQQLGGKRAGWQLWCCVAVAVAGLFLLTVDPEEGVSMGLGDLLVLCCAVCFSCHILLVARFGDTDGLLLSCVQFLTAGTLSSLALLCIGIPLLHEAPTFAGILDGWFPLVYAGVLSSGVAYTLQIFGQKYTPPTLASLLMSLESVFALLTAIVIDGEWPNSPLKWIGSGLMFAAILAAQIPRKKAR